MAGKGSAPPGRTKVRLTATDHAPARARAAVTQWADEVGLDDELLVDLRLLVSEVVTNAVRYGRPKSRARIELEAEAVDGRVRVRVRDGGDGFDEYLPIPSADDISGRGLYVVHRAASAWGVDAGPPFGIWFELDRA
jgi:anti-sigma regulatory factor (Ser/Thr protein kinase)